MKDAGNQSSLNALDSRGSIEAARDPTLDADAGQRAGGATRSRVRPAHALAFDLAHELRVFEAIKANLTVHNEELDDPSLMMILAEGETNLLELLDFLLNADLEDEGLIAGLKLNKDTLAARLHRLEERRQSRRSVLEQALMLLERKSLERPIATITLSDRAPQLVVEEEALVPARFFDLRPVLNKRLLKQALEAGEQAPGAKLSNGTVTLSVRRR